MLIFKQLIGLFWLIFYAYWLISASNVKRNVRGTHRGWTVGVRIVLILSFFVMLRIHRFQRAEDMHETVAHDSIARGIGVILCAAGLAFAIWARRHIGRNWGVPMSVKENPDLVTSGPYALVRHPIYAGMLLAMVGSVLTLGIVWLIPFSVFCAYALYSAKAEERLMTKEFPEEYPRYQKNTKLLIPFVL
jgi:protein-S-isoprenylcysteine O-methyltransferase Ste14